MEVKVISIRQPWAWLIMNGFKDIENRTWKTNFRGRVYIHASKGCTKDEWEEAWFYVRGLCPEAWVKGCEEITAGSIERGGIIGSVDIVDCVRKSSSPWFNGKFGFVIKDPKPMEFYPLKGRLGFFNATLDHTTKEPTP